MRTNEIVSRVLVPLKGLIHGGRLKCLVRLVLGATTSRELALTMLGRSLQTTAKLKHAIKSVDRFLGNPYVDRDRSVLEYHFASLLSEADPVLLVDWTDIGKGWTALVASFVVEGRSLALCWIATEKGKQNSAKIETQLLDRIAELLPGKKVTLVADAGFRGPWARKITRKGWDFISRVRGRVSARSASGGQWKDIKQLWPDAPCPPTDLGEVEIARARPLRARVIVLRRKPKKKKKKDQKPSRIGRRKKKAIRSAKEPVVLATSLRTQTAEEVAELYARRWEIEMMFRDQKCDRYGLGLDLIRTKSLQRVSAYLLLAVLAHYVAYVVGAMVEKAGHAKDFQANTEKRRRVLSLPRLGCEFLLRAISQHVPVDRLSAFKALTLWCPHPRTLHNRGDP